jgi:hypothetical protein
LAAAAAASPRPPLPGGAAAFFSDEALPVALVHDGHRGRAMQAKCDVPVGCLIVAAEAYACACRSSASVAYLPALTCTRHDRQVCRCAIVPSVVPSCHRAVMYRTHISPRRRVGACACLRRAAAIAWRAAV